MSRRVKIELPQKLAELYDAPFGSVMGRVSRGGRGSGKSYAAALMSAVFGMQRKMRIVCLRDTQNSIKESMHAEIKGCIASHWFLAQHYDVGVDYVRGKFGTEYIFKGLRANTESVKSLAGVDLWIVEESEQVREQSWIDLMPTVRKDGSELWVIYNPRKKDSACNRRFGVGNMQHGYIDATINIDDNPFASKNLLLQRAHDKRTMSVELYRHVWLGDFLERGDDKILARKVTVQEFDSCAFDAARHYGVDYGFASDPIVAIECFVHNNTLYIEREFSAVGLPLGEIKGRVHREIANIAQSVVRADSARPEVTDMLLREGFGIIESCRKGPSSIKAGIDTLLSFEKIIIHPRCKLASREFTDYSWRVDRITGSVSDEPLDADNNSVDAVRYALQDYVFKGDYCNLVPSVGRLSARESEEYVASNGRHLDFYAPLFVNDKIVYKCHVAINRVTADVIVLRESICVRSSMPLIMTASDNDHDGAISLCDSSLETSVANSIIGIAGKHCTTVDNDAPRRDELISHIINTKSLKISKNCKLMISSITSYSTQYKSKIGYFGIESLGLALLYHNYNASKMTPVIKFDSTDQREIATIDHDYEQDIVVAGLYNFMDDI